VEDNSDGEEKFVERMSARKKGNNEKEKPNIRPTKEKE